MSNALPIVGLVVAAANLLAWVVAVIVLLRLCRGVPGAP